MARFLVAVVLLVVLGSLPLCGQNTDIEALSGLQFNFANPGARSLGMGGAFLALADDASAAEANPAGLTILRKPEVTIEGRDTAVSQRFVTGGTYPNILRADFPAREHSISFASVVVPFERFALAAYYHRPLDFHNRVSALDASTTPTYFLGPDGPATREACPSTPGCREYRIYPFSTSADLELQTYGIALAWKHERLSLGGAIRYQRFREVAYAYRTDLDAPGTPRFVVAQMNGGRMFGDKVDQDVTYSIGAKWAVADSLSVGAVYKSGASFPAPLYGASSVGGQLDLIRTTRFHVPDIIGAGVSYRPAAALTVNADVVRIGYTHLTDRFVSLIEYSSSSGEIESIEGYRTNDGTEIHAGVEYFIMGRMPIAIRGGWWRDPAHSIEFQPSGCAQCSGPRTPHDMAATILFPPGKDEDHYTVGIGVALQRFQIDAAFDQSESLKVGSISMVTRF